jgi:transcription termination factor NusB
VDSSVLGYTADDIKEFDTDERQEAFTDVYHQALDLLTEIQEGFSPYLNQGVKAEQLDSVKKAVKLLKATRP